MGEKSKCKICFSFFKRQLNVFRQKIKLKTIIAANDLVNSRNSKVKAKSSFKISENEWETPVQASLSSVNVDSQIPRKFIDSQGK